MSTAAAVRHLREPRHWYQLLRFCLVGASGYVVNLAIFYVFTEPLGTGHRAAAVAAFLVAVTNNFVWNRRWTFAAHEGHPGSQAARFLAVSVVAFGFSLAFLELLVTGLDVPDLPAQAIAIVCATPLSFVGNRLWSFRR